MSVVDWVCKKISLESCLRADVSYFLCCRQVNKCFPASLTHAQTLPLAVLVKLIFECEHPFIDEPMVITEPAVPIALVLGVISPGCILATCSVYSTTTLTRIDSCRIFSLVPQNWAIKRKALLSNGFDNLTTFIAMIYVTYPTTIWICDTVVQ